MPEPAAKTSQRFSRAARAERDRLARKQAQIEKRRQSFQDKLLELERELEAINNRMRLIESVAEPGERIEVPKLAPRTEESALLTGATIREHAVALLLRDRGENPIHYREWLGLLNQRGYEVAGKRPDAVFLNQITRSPVVRATTQSGYYQLDLSAVERLRREQSKLVTELAESSEAPTTPGSFEQRRERQRELSQAITKTERALEEATEALSALDEEPPAIRAA